MLEELLIKCLLMFLVVLKEFRPLPVLHRAHPANQFGSRFMSLDMLLLVTLLRECLITSKGRAQIRLFPDVRPQVVEQIVPVREMHIALFLPANKDP